MPKQDCPRPERGPDRPRDTRHARRPGPATQPANYNLQYTGLIDGYYLYQFSSPRFNKAPYTTNNLGYPRSYDIRQNSPTLNLAEINVFQNPRPNGYGFKFTLVSEIGLDKDKLNGTIGSPFFATDGSGNAVANVNTRVTVNDNNFTYNFDSNHLAGLDFQYIELKPNGGPKITNTGYADYYRQQLNPKDAVALRVSGVDVKTGSFTNVAESFGTTHVHPCEVTATYEIKAAPSFTTRFEYRHDPSNDTTLAGLFGGSTPDKKDQDSLAVGALFMF